jgi:hypothetical protein
MVVSPKEEVTFLKKSNQKTFLLLGPGAFSTPREAEQKSFLVLFFKKERLA